MHVKKCLITVQQEIKKYLEQTIQQSNMSMMENIEALEYINEMITWFGP